MVQQVSHDWDCTRLLYIINHILYNIEELETELTKHKLSVNNRLATLAEEKKKLLGNNHNSGLLRSLGSKDESRLLTNCINDHAILHNLCLLLQPTMAIEITVALLKCQIDSRMGSNQERILIGNTQLNRR